MKFLALAEDQRKEARGEAAGRDFLSAFTPGGGQPQASGAALPASGGAVRTIPGRRSDARIYENDEASPLDPPSGGERDAVIRTMLSEAGNQGPTGLNAVGSVIRNRSVGGDVSPTEVVTAKNQFEPWNTAGGRAKMASYDPNSPAYQAAARGLDAAYFGNDPTNGATHFYSPKAQAALGRAPPRWDDGTGVDINGHRFFGGAAGGERTPQPYQVAAGGAVAPPSRDAQELQQAGGQQALAFQQPAQQPAPFQQAPPTQVAQAPQQAGGAATPSIPHLLQAIANPYLPAGQKDIAKMYLQKSLEAEKTPDHIKQLQILKRDSGYPGTLLDLEKELKSLAKTEVNINQKGESKFEEEFAKVDAKRFGDIREAGEAARKKLVDVETMREIHNRAGSQGVLAGVKDVLGPYADAAGINIEGLSDIQAYASVVERLAPQQRAPGSGSTSDVEYKGFKKSLPQLMQNPAAREVTLNVLEGLTRDEIARGDIVSKLSSKEITRAEAEKALRALPDPMKAFSEWRKANPEAYGAAIKGANAPKQTPKMSPSDVADSLANARAAIAKTPAAKDAIIKKLRDNGINTDGL